MVAKKLDCVVLGAGPAGLSAAIWLNELGIQYNVLENHSRLGGEIERINLPIRNYLGIEPMVGRDFLQRIAARVSEHEPNIVYNAGVSKVDLENRVVHTCNGPIYARTLIVATGQTRRVLNVEGAQKLLGNGLSYSATAELDRLRGRRVVVVGAGDGAFENALLLAEICPQVHIIARNPQPKARRSFVLQVQQTSNIAVHLGWNLVGLDINVEGLCGVQIKQGHRGPRGESFAAELVESEGLSRLRTLACDWVVAKIGFVPNTQFFTRQQIVLDDAGYLVVDRQLHTSVAGVFAAGDVCNSRTPCIAAAVGDGAVAAREVSLLLEHESA